VSHYTVCGCMKQPLLMLNGLPETKNNITLCFKNPGIGPADKNAVVFIETLTN
jgi:hypothetical protein